MNRKQPVELPTELELHNMPLAMDIFTHQNRHRVKKIYQAFLEVKILGLTLILSSALAIFGILMGCGGGGTADGSSSAPGPTPTPTPTRTWEMGFYPTPPRFNIPEILRTIDLLSSRAELAVLHEELPWTELLSGKSTTKILEEHKDGLIGALHDHGLRILFMADLTDGLARYQEPPQLRALGRSITEPAVQQLYRDYVLTFAQRFHPEYIGLTAETNLVRRMASPAVYAAMVQAANNAASDLQAAHVTSPLLISVQVETAWGVFGSSEPYAGIEQDFSDFPFMQMLGLSSYPYFSYAVPEDIPDNYYRRLLNGRSMPVLVCEGGWTSAGVDAIVSSPQVQARYIRRQADLLDSVQARAMAQTLFVDIDMDQLTVEPPPNLYFFISLGLMDKDFQAKPALEVWDDLFARSKI
ncbi:MAG: hypothetical protein M0036_02240 [Desulfobacteraceae bacterium]|nr:hypothetical protein [Desulfobacteraceae bacterium]